MDYRGAAKHEVCARSIPVLYIVGRQLLELKCSFVFQLYTASMPYCLSGRF